LSLILYSRNDCQLCDVFESELAELVRTNQLKMEKIDVDSLPELQALYGNDVPVLALNERIICQHFFDQDKILKALL